MIRVMHTHVYPGCRATTDQSIQAGAVHVEFSDGSIAQGSVGQLLEGKFTLSIDAYTTAKGTSIKSKSWLVEPEKEGFLHVTRRLVSR